MKFDVIIGNPPFQDQRKNNTLYPKFLNIAFNKIRDNGIIMLITPTAILPGLWGEKVDGIKMLFQGKIQNICVLTEQEKRNYFNGVGSTFCYFNLKKENNPDNSNVPVKIGDKIAYVPNHKFINANNGDLDFSIIQKVNILMCKNLHINILIPLFYGG